MIKLTFYRLYLDSPATGSGYRLGFFLDGETGKNRMFYIPSLLVGVTVAAKEAGKAIATEGRCAYVRKTLLDNITAARRNGRDFNAKLALVALTALRAGRDTAAAAIKTEPRAEIVKRREGVEARNEHAELLRAAVKAISQAAAINPVLRKIEAKAKRDTNGGICDKATWVLARMRSPEGITNREIRDFTNMSAYCAMFGRKMAKRHALDFVEQREGRDLRLRLVDRVTQAA